MHDANGKPLKVGDEVVLRAKITSLCEGVSTYCNVSVEFTHRMPTQFPVCSKCGAEIDPGKNTTGAHGYYSHEQQATIPCEGTLVAGRIERMSSVNTKMLEKVE